MIRVSPAEEPDDFDSQVRQPGLRAIATLAGYASIPARSRRKEYRSFAARAAAIAADEFPTHWRRSLEDLLRAYDRICAYAAVYIEKGTGAASTDHFAPKSLAWDKVYEWCNYRLACSQLNAKKREFGDVLDPFDVVDDWFRLELDGFQILPSPALDEETREQVEHTILRLGLNDPVWRERRESDATEYWKGDVSWRHIARRSPFVARELLRQGRVRPEDRPTPTANPKGTAPTKPKRPRR